MTPAADPFAADPAPMAFIWAQQHREKSDYIAGYITSLV
jgi:hypothetical protein